VEGSRSKSPSGWCFDGELGITDEASMGQMDLYLKVREAKRVGKEYEIEVWQSVRKKV
jgi:hypothetical protein